MKPLLKTHEFIGELLEAGKIIPALLIISFILMVIIEKI